jgi:hypothetical protein
MFTYRFSQREKAMLLGLMIILITLTWYKFVYQTTTDQITSLEAQIQETQTTISTEQTRLQQQKNMQASIDRHKAAGDKTVPIPEYDNFKRLVSSLDKIMKRANRYSLSFDAINTEVSDYIRRGVGMQFSATSYEVAKEIIKSIAEGKYPCVIDSVSVTNSYTTTDWLTNRRAVVPASASIHVTFFEKPNEDQLAAAQAAADAQAQAEAAAAAASAA